jgi:hypothetical protein
MKSARLRPASLAIAMAVEVFLFLSASVFLTTGAHGEGRPFIACALPQHSLVSCLHCLGLLGMALTLVLLTIAEMKKSLPVHDAAPG